MKYLMLLASFVGAYVAQRIDITLPAFDTNVFSGQNITVQISQNVCSLHIARQVFVHDCKIKGHRRPLLKRNTHPLNGALRPVISDHRL